MFYSIKTSSTIVSAASCNPNLWALLGLQLVNSEIWKLKVQRGKARKFHHIFHLECQFLIKKFLLTFSKALFWFSLLSRPTVERGRFWRHVYFFRFCLCLTLAAAVTQIGQTKGKMVHYPENNKTIFRERAVTRAFSHSKGQLTASERCLKEYWIGQITINNYKFHPFPHRFHTVIDHIVFKSRHARRESIGT